MNTKPPYHIHSDIKEITLNKKVILRADLNVPLNNGIILDDFRLKALKPTLDILHKNNAHTLIITHIGRPKNKESTLSTQQLIAWFIKNNYNCVYAASIEEAHDLLSHHQFILLENIRFWPEEKNADTAFAQQLKGNTQIYVMEAFAASHRADTSVATLPTLYDKQHRTIGLLVEQELNELNKLISNPKKPFAVLLGGAKIETKLPLIKHLLPLVDTIALLPPLSTTFEKARGKEVGTSLYDPSLLSKAHELLLSTNNKFLLPSDYLVAKNWNNEQSYALTNTIAADTMILTIGPKTVQHYAEKLASTKTLFFNGASGDIRYSKSCETINDLLTKLCPLEAFKVGAGGDTIAMIELCKKESCFNFLSTGGGATLSYLSGEPLPGLIPFI